MPTTKKVVLMSPTNLISALRLSLDLWKKENQVKNVQAIIKRGTILYEKIAGFTDTFLGIGDRLASLQRDYDKAFNQLSDGNGSVVRQAEMLKGMSLTPKKRISPRCCPKIPFKKKQKRKTITFNKTSSNMKTLKDRILKERKMLPRGHSESRQLH